MRYLVLEIQTNADGTVGNIITSFDDRNQAESQYHNILHYAAISNLPMHAAVILTNDGKYIDSKCYEHYQGHQGG